MYWDEGPNDVVHNSVMLVSASLFLKLRTCLSMGSASALQWLHEWGPHIGAPNNTPTASRWCHDSCAGQEKPACSHVPDSLVDNHSHVIIWWVPLPTAEGMGRNQNMMEEYGWLTPIMHAGSKKGRRCYHDSIWMSRLRNLISIFARSQVNLCWSNGDLK